MSLEKFVTELQDTNKILYEVDDVMSEADFESDSYYNFVFERLSTASTCVVKASYFFTLVPNKLKREYTTPLLTTAVRLRKTFRAMFLWVVLSNTSELIFTDEQGEQADLVTTEDIVGLFKHLCDTLDVTHRLIISEDVELVKYGNDKIEFLLDIAEELLDLLNVMGYDDNKKEFLNSVIIDIIKVISKLSIKASWRLGADE